MQTALFWITWGIISVWALKTFYYSYDKNKLNKLRRTALGIDFAVLVLFFLSWLPTGRTGWELIQEGNLLVISLGVLIGGSIFAFSTNDKLWLKIGAIAHLSASVLFIFTMTRLLPGTFTMTLQSVAPILASLLLLIGNVVVLLMWQQLQLKARK